MFSWLLPKNLNCSELPDNLDPLSSVSPPGMSPFRIHVGFLCFETRWFRMSLGVFRQPRCPICILIASHFNILGHQSNSLLLATDPHVAK